MSDVEVDLEDAASYFGSFTHELDRAAKRGLLSAAHQAVSVILVSIIPTRTPSPVDRGIYRSGWRAKQEEYGASFGNDEPHAGFIEDGVRAANVKPGRAMITALAAWATRKGIASGKDSLAAAWAISRAMQRRGIFKGGTGMGILREVIDQHIERLVQEEVAREIERSI